MSMGDPNNFFVHPLLRAHNWQHRPELDRVCDWWRGGGRGICALVGMGGAGKTAIAERFLRILSGGLPADPAVSKDSSLPAPHSVFVFSFYDAPNPEAFFEALQMWLEHTARPQTVMSVGQMLYLLQQTPGLVVMDGLEKVQEDGARGAFGRLNSPKLRDFLDHLAAGYVPELSVLITSRFPLADLRDKHPRFFRTQPVDQIDVAAGIQLLRDRGVRGTDGQLESVVEQCGRHALTVDFAGGYLAEYAQGDPATPLDLGTAEQLQTAAEREPNEDRRAVIKQGHRFARIAGHYRQAMLRTDEAAMALLERICLFRLGVDCETLAAIFTGPEAEKVSGKALAELNCAQVQSKLDWLVRMRIVEKAEVRRMNDEKGENSSFSIHPSAIYSIHPAVRDGFLSRMSGETARASHEAVRKGLEVFLGETPGANPSDPATLDLLEEIVHHTLQSGHVTEAWDIYENRMGQYQNLGWRLGAYERGERICRAFAGGATPESIRPLSPEGKPRGEGDERSSGMQTPSETTEAGATAAGSHPYESLPETLQAIFINEWALYLRNLGRLATAARCCELDAEMALREENWRYASMYNQNLCEMFLVNGRLSGPRPAVDLLPDDIEPAGEIAGDQPSPHSALQTADEALRLAELIDNAKGRTSSHAFRAHARGLLGRIPAALADFRAARDWQHKAESDDEQPLYSLRGIQHTNLLAHLGRRKEAMRLTEANRDILFKVAGPENYHDPPCQLILSTLHVESGELSTAERLCASARTWAEARDAKEVLCWSYLVQAQVELAGVRDQGPGISEDESREVRTAIDSGLKIARDCGFGLFHIDLLLERARLHLLRGDPDAALADIELALDTGIPADPTTGQQELLPASDQCCGYVWAIPAGLQLRAEAQLLQAAQQLGSDSFVPAKRDELPDEVINLIDAASRNLATALEHWQPLHDPEPERDDQNFLLDGKPYNYRAAETWQILQDLAVGVLTRYPLASITPCATDENVKTPSDENQVSETFDVFLSHNSKDKPAIRELGEALRQRGHSVWLDEWELVPGQPWQEALEEIIKTTKSAVVAVGADGLGPWEVPEMRACLSEFVNRKLPVIPVLLPGAPTRPELPLFLKAFTWVDLRGGINDVGLDRLQWGITGKKP